MSEEYAVFEELPVEPKDVLDCQFSEWYSKFSEHTWPSIIIKPLAKEFLDYLNSDGIKIPHGYDNKVEQNSNNEYSDWSDAEEETEVHSNEELSPGFREFHQTIEKSIAKLGGSVIPKLNWSAPKDAVWMMPNNSLECRTPSDIYLLLKSSDHIVHDLDHPYDICTNNEEVSTPKFELVLRKWVPINPALEFRVFVRNGFIIGVSQRDLNHYIFLEPMRQRLGEVIENFYNTIVKPKLGSPDFVLDLYVSQPSMEVTIVDFNVFARQTDSLLFTWNELLLSPLHHNYELRLVTENNVARFNKKQYNESQVPIDVISAVQNPDTLVELARSSQQQQAVEPENSQQSIT